jgi:hypothetical protein
VTGPKLPAPGALEYLGSTFKPTPADAYWGTGGAFAGWIGAAQEESARLMREAGDSTAVAGVQQSIADNPKNPAYVRARAAAQVPLANQGALDKAQLAQRTLGLTKVLPEQVRSGFAANAWDTVSSVAAGSGTLVGDASLGAKTLKAVPYIGTGLAVFQGVSDVKSGQKTWVRAAAETVGSVGGGALAGAVVAGLTSWSGPGAVAAGVAAGAGGGYVGSKLGTMAVDGVNRVFGTKY